MKNLNLTIVYSAKVGCNKFVTICITAFNGKMTFLTANFFSQKVGLGHYLQDLGVYMMSELII